MHGVGDVGNHLHRLAEVVSTALGFDDLGVDFTGREVVVLGQVDVKEAFVVAEVKVNFTTVVEDEDFAVFKRRHGSCIAVEVGVNLDRGDPQASGFQQHADAAGGDTFSES